MLSEVDKKYSISRKKKELQSIGVPEAFLNDHKQWIGRWKSKMALMLGEMAEEKEDYLKSNMEKELDLYLK